MEKEVRGERLVIMRKLAPILPIISGTLFGTVGIFVRGLFDGGFDGVTILFTRAAVAAIVLFIYLFIKDRSYFRFDKKNLPYMLFCSLVCMFGTNMCFNVSSVELTLSLAAVLLSIFPIYVMFASRIMFGEKITSRKVICMFMAIAGCVMVSGVIGSDVHLSGKGLLAGLISGITYGAYGIASKKAVDNGMKGLTMTFYCLLFLAIALAPFSDYGAIGTYLVQAPVRHGLFMLTHSLCVAVFSYLTYTIALQYIEPGLASILASCEPVAAMVFGLIFFAEIPSVISIAGLIITLVALTILVKPEKKELT